jgi:hypothetical protein
MSIRSQLAGSGRKRPFALASLALALYFLLQTASPIAASPNSHASPGRLKSQTLMLATSGWSMGRLWHKGEVFLSNRTRMIQLATLGMCLGIYIMMRSGRWR